MHFRGRSQGGALPPFCKQTTYNRWQKRERHKNLVSSPPPPWNILATRLYTSRTTNDKLVYLIKYTVRKAVTVSSRLWVSWITALDNITIRVLNRDSHRLGTAFWKSGICGRSWYWRWVDPSIIGSSGKVNACRHQIIAAAIMEERINPATAMVPDEARESASILILGQIDLELLSKLSRMIHFYRRVHSCVNANPY